MHDFHMLLTRTWARLWIVGEILLTTGRHNLSGKASSPSYEERHGTRGLEIDMK